MLRARLALPLAGLLVACSHPLHRIEPIAPARAARAPAAARVLVFGDFGLRTVPQWLTARAMRRESERRPFDLAIQLGDNLYYCGPDAGRAGTETCRFEADGATVAPGATPPDDPRFAVNERPMRRLRARDGGPLPIYLALGNHDVFSTNPRCAAPGLSLDETERRKACLNVARRTETWLMPARHYVVDRGPLRLIVVDTNVVVRDYGGFTLEQEIAFLRRATAPCAEPGRVCLVAGHHPPAAAHGYGRRLRPSPHGARMMRLLQASQGRVRAFFAGHVHNLAHLTLDDLEVFVSGATAMGGYSRLRVQVPARAQLRFATTAWGFTTVEVDSQGGYRVAYLGFQGEPLHCCEAGSTGPCRPVSCASR